MLRLRSRLVGNVFGGLAAAGACRTYCSEAPRKVITMDSVWDLWNEGNLFSLTAEELLEFLKTQDMEVDPRWKKSVLVRQVEGLLQSREEKAGGGSGGKGNQGDTYGKWENSTMETLLDLNQTGFYEGGNQMVPRAFQMFVDRGCPDVVISRVNTTAFPGYPSNAEVYALCCADNNLAMKHRFSKAFQWCVMNLQNVGSEGEVSIDFGKLLLTEKALKANQDTVSQWTLQQRLQAENPHQWVSCVHPDATADATAFLTEKGFEKVSKKAAISYDVTIRRADDLVEMELNGKAQPKSVFKPWDSFHAAHITRGGSNSDFRLQLRARQQLKKKDNDAFLAAKVIKLTSDSVECILPPELGEAIYVSENEVTTWKKENKDLGVEVEVSEIKRTPLVITFDEQEGDRTEYLINVKVPSKKKPAEMNALSMFLFDTASEFASVVDKTWGKFQATVEAPKQ